LAVSEQPMNQLRSASDPRRGRRERGFRADAGLLVRATSGDGNLVFANPGDWGIDVLVGDLNGRVRRGSATSVLIVDQCEQLFTACRSQQERRAFITVLLAAADGDTPAALTASGDYPAGLLPG
jgi:hypothetical protein